MDYEAALISQIVIEKRMTEVVDAGVQPELFVSHKSEWEFLLDFQRNHGSSPPPEQFEKLFPDFDLQLYSAPTSFLIEELRKRRAHNLVAEGIKEAAAALKKKDPFKALDGLRTVVLQGESEARASNDVNIVENPLRRTEDYKKLVEMGGVTGLPTPWPVLDEVTLGFHPEELIMLVARGGVGKTWAEVVLARFHWALHGITPLVISKEMAVKQIVRRFDAAHAQLPYQRFRSGQLTQDEYERWVQSLKDMEGARPFWVSGDEDGEGGVAGVEAKIDKYQPGCCYIDGLALMKDDQGASSVWEKLSNLSEDLKSVARRKRIPIIVSHWFSKDGKGETGTADDLKFGDIQNHYDLIIGMYQTEDLRLNKEMLWRILKQREGERLEFVSDWDLEAMGFDVKSLGEDDVPTETVAVEDDTVEEVRF